MVSEPIVLATANPDKVVEISKLLSGADLRPRPDSVPEVDETGETLVDNARLKALALVSASGMAAVADDTGLEVAALHGAPGVRSARFAGENVTYEDNVRKLLSELTDVPVGNRGARFRTVALLRRPDGSELIAEGSVEGTIALEPRGSRGFGYDPVFIPDGCGGKTFAELSTDEKNDVSHRGAAFRKLAELLSG